MWLFMPGHTIPLSLGCLNNTMCVSWLYDNNTQSLVLGSLSNKHMMTPCSFSWLSAKLHIESHTNVVIEYDLDNFLEKFRVFTNTDEPPTLYMIFICWCIYTRQWFILDDTIEFVVITDMGEELRFSFENHNFSIDINNNKLYMSSLDKTEDNIDEINSNDGNNFQDNNNYQNDKEPLLDTDTNYENENTKTD
jgi:hypothetical protein